MDSLTVEYPTGYWRVWVRFPLYLCDSSHVVVRATWSISCGCIYLIYRNAILWTRERMTNGSFKNSFNMFLYSTKSYQTHLHAVLVRPCTRRRPHPRNRQTWMLKLEISIEFNFQVLHVCVYDDLYGYQSWEHLAWSTVHYFCLFLR